jgi:hypothetical protein
MTASRPDRLLTGEVVKCYYVLFLYLQTKTAQIVGVAGTDVPVEDIKKLLFLHKVNVVRYFGLHTKSTRQFLGIIFADTCDIMRKLIQ